MLCQIQNECQFGMYSFQTCLALDHRQFLVYVLLFNLEDIEFYEKLYTTYQHQTQCIKATTRH